MPQETESQKYAKFVKWLWLKRTVQKDFHVNVLTESNAKADSSLPSPPLTQLESEDLFRFLESNKLVFLQGHVTSGGNVYSLNRVEDYKWEETIKELEKQNWKRSEWFLIVKKGILYVLSVAVAALLGAYMGFLAEKLVRTTVKSPPTEIDSKASSNSKTNQP